MNKVYCIKDDSGHWYVIPVELKELFIELLENDEDNEFENFNELFDKYRTGGDLNLIQLYAEI